MTITYFNIAKGTTDPRVECSYQSNFFRSYHKFLHKSRSNFIFRISTKHQLRNLNQTSASQLNLNFKSLTNPTFRISTKIKLHNLNQASAEKYWSNFSFKILSELQLLNLDQTLWSKSEQKFNLMTKLQHQTDFNTCISIYISNSNNLKNFWVGIFACHGHIKFTKQQWVSQSVSDNGSKMIGLGSDNNVSWWPLCWFCIIIITVSEYLSWWPQDAIVLWWPLCWPGFKVVLKPNAAKWWPTIWIPME